MSNESRENRESSPFAAHVQQQDAPDEAPLQQPPGMSFVGRAMVFLVFPMTVGMCGLYIGYLRTIKNPEKKLDFDDDFVFPFLMALVFVIVVGFQTNGFRQKKMTPLVQWPKVKRKKKIIRKKVYVDENGNEVPEQDAKKNE